MTTLPRILGWTFVGLLLFLALHLPDQAAGRPKDLGVDAFVAANGALTLAGMWQFLAERSPWSAYWIPRLLSELCHWCFDLFWLSIFALLSLLLIPLLAPVLILAPPVVATVLLVRRYRSNPCPSPERLPLWL